MAITIDWGNTFVISIPQSDLTLISGTLYEFDTEAFREELIALEDDVEGMPWPRTHNHNTTVTISGVIYTRAIELLAPYSLTFEDTASAYSVKAIGSNNNFFDQDSGVLNPTPLVSYISTNAAGLIIAETGVSGLTPTESTALLDIDTNVSAVGSDVQLLSDGVFGQKVMIDAVDKNTDPGYMILWDEVGALLGHKEIYEAHVLAGDPSNVGYTRSGRGIAFEGALTAGMPP